ncbi:hypothetical protein ACFFHM_23675 [Halalkalibacter kiskunsagensis]|uniref:Adhesin domain-containing protein n=1 Tax=Halalkalibacter kiskunsagensis TaxID=1548599 RepID=A0ABV6KJA6_9BACI
MNNFMSGLIYLIAIVALTGCNIVTYEYEETYTLDSNGLSSFTINQDEGDVTITGIDNSNEITVTATFAALSDQDVEHAQKFSEQNTSLELTADGNVGQLNTSVKRGAEVEQGFVHLMIEVPNDLDLTYRQNEGQLKISGMKSDIRLQHGANHLTLVDIEGNIEITDGAGDVTLENVSGDLIINNNSGTTSVLDSSGQLRLVAGSGNIDFRNHQGDITIRSGGGNINIHTVRGDVTILESRGGSINVEDVTGNVTQP